MSTGLVYVVGCSECGSTLDMGSENRELSALKKMIAEAYRETSWYTLPPSHPSPLPRVLAFPGMLSNSDFIASRV
jgi:hypothetical protein